VRRLAACPRSHYNLNMSIVVIGDTAWDFYEMAARVVRRLVARYGPDIVIIHGNELGVDAAFAASAKGLGVTRGAPRSRGENAKVLIANCATAGYLVV
jgi:hypothetical protein